MSSYRVLSPYRAINSSKLSSLDGVYVIGYFLMGGSLIRSFVG
jgi:hypothetical protein